MPFERIVRVAVICGLAGPCGGQQTPVRPVAALPPPIVTRLEQDMARSEGVEPGSQITYVRLFRFAVMSSLPAGDMAATVGDTAIPFKRPTLTGQCTRDGHGELFVNFGGVPDGDFYPPWKAGPQELFPPATPKVKMTLEFVGYKRISPFKRQFEAVTAPGEMQLRYVPPGQQSSNLDPPGWMFAYLRALPTLRVSAMGKSADFAMTGWLEQLRKEPLCAASGA